MLRFHLIAFFGGFLLDLLFGDPCWLPHPVRLIGKWINGLEKRLIGREDPLLMGKLLVFLVLFLTGSTSFILLFASYRLFPYAGCLLETVMTYQILAVKCLKEESMKVYDRLKNGTLEEARTAVSKIVGRDTKKLDETGIIRAAVETVAENTSDGVLAPMLYLAVGGPFLGFLYKAVNTMDSMVGYKNERYFYFGRAAAKLDDAVNYFPARISGFLMAAVSFIAGRDFNGKRAFLVYKRDRKNHASPNSAQTEAACAGALGIRLGGNLEYFGKTVEKPWIGEDCRPAVCEDIKRANHLLYLTAWVCELLCLLPMVCLLLL